jgi:hypothetical protein
MGRIYLVISLTAGGGASCTDVSANKLNGTPTNMTGHTLAKGRAATLIKLAFALDKRLKAIGKHTYLIYGNHLRQGLNSDLTFTDEDRTENIRRVGVVAKLFVDAGLIAIVVLISTFKIDRLTDLVKKGEFIEVYMSTPLEVLGVESFSVWIVNSGVVGFMAFTDLGIGLQNVLSKARGQDVYYAASTVYMGILYS